MIDLLIASVVWAFSFSLIKGQLAGLEPSGVAAVRVLLSAISFLPFLRLRRLDLRLALQLLGIGLVQYGVMYLAYIYSFTELAAHEVALLTLTTPLFVAGIGELYARRCRVLVWGAALLAVAGAVLVSAQGSERPRAWVGVAAVQLSNVCFAAGQVAYRNLRGRHPELEDLHVYSLLYLGAALAAVPPALASWDGSLLAARPTQLWTLAYLGVLASGVCFFLWNRGATKVDTGTLAVMNNLKVPLAVLVALLFFGESAQLLRLAAGGGLLVLALLLMRRAREPHGASVRLAR